MTRSMWRILGLIVHPIQRFLTYAKREQRTVVKTDLEYPRLLALTQALEPSPFLFRGGDWKDREVIDRIQAVLDTQSDC
jgi:hypothetical protein